MFGLESHDADRHPAARSTDARVDLRAAALLVVAFVAAAWFVSLKRGPWIDELWSLWLTQSELSFGDIMRQRWLADFHPPLFSMLHWLAGPWIGDHLPSHRLINLLPLAWAASFVAVAARRFPHKASLLCVFAITLLSFSGSLRYFAEMRSYFMQMCLLFVLTGAAVVIAELSEDLDWHKDRAFATMLLATIVVALNLHYFSSLLAGVLVSTLIVCCWFSGKRRWARALASALAFGCLALLAFLWVHLQFLSHESTAFWVDATLAQAIVVIGRSVASAAEANPLVLGVAAAVLLASIAVVVRRPVAAGSRAIFDADFLGRLQLTRERRRSIGLLGFSLAVFSVALLLVHLRQPIVFHRYLLSFQVVVVGLVACLAAEAVASRRLLLMLVAAVAFVSVAQHGAKAQGERRWDATARFVSDLRATCPSSPVVAARLPGHWQTVNIAAVAEWGYRWEAQRFGFDVTYVRLGVDPLPIAPGACPTLLWIEHLTWNSRLPRNATPETALRVLGIDTSRIEMANALFIAGETGFVMRLPAKAGSPATEPRTQS